MERGSFRSHGLPAADGLARLPYWLLAAILLGLYLLWVILSDGDYRVIFRATIGGLWTTIWVSLVAYLLAVLAGLAIGLLRLSPSRLLREAASFYVEIIRGVPMLVILYYIAFVGAPSLVEAWNWVTAPLISMDLIKPLNIRQVGYPLRAVFALMIGYSAFLAEIFRAGIEAVPKGQVEAAESLGLSRGQTLSRVVLPQATRIVLPPLGNEFVAMLKDSALVSVLGVQDITQMGKVYAASTFKFFESFNVVAFLYLIMTVGLSMLVRGLEDRLKKRG